MNCDAAHGSRRHRPDLCLALPEDRRVDPEVHDALRGRILVEVPESADEAMPPPEPTNSYRGASASQTGVERTANPSNRAQMPDDHGLLVADGVLVVSTALNHVLQYLPTLGAPPARPA